MNSLKYIKDMEELRGAILKAKDKKEHLKEIAKAQRKKKKKTSHILEEIKALQTDILRLEVYQSVLEKEENSRPVVVKKRGFFARLWQTRLIKLFGV